MIEETTTDFNPIQVARPVPIDRARKSDQVRKIRAQEQDIIHSVVLEFNECVASRDNSERRVVTISLRESYHVLDPIPSERKRIEKDIESLLIQNGWHRAFVSLGTIPCIRAYKEDMDAPEPEPLPLGALTVLPDLQSKEGAMSVGQDGELAVLPNDGPNDGPNDSHYDSPNDSDVGLVQILDPVVRLSSTWAPVDKTSQLFRIAKNTAIVLSVLLGAAVGVLLFL